MIEAFIKHFNTPKTKRKRRRLQKKEQRQPILYRWFGLVPYSIKMFLQKYK